MSCHADDVSAPSREIVRFPNGGEVQPRTAYMSALSSRGPPLFSFFLLGRRVSGGHWSERATKVAGLDKAPPAPKAQGAGGPTVNRRAQVSQGWRVSATCP